MSPGVVLIIDDDDVFSHLIELSLTQIGGLILRRASDGQSGAEMAEADRPALILLDFELPGMDGLDTLRRLRANALTAHIPIVAMTGSNRNLPRVAEMITGCDAYLPKPFEIYTLYHLVQTLLERRG